MFEVTKLVVGVTSLLLCLFQFTTGEEFVVNPKILSVKRAKVSDLGTQKYDKPYGTGERSSITTFTAEADDSNVLDVDVDRIRNDIKGDGDGPVKLTVTLFEENPPKVKKLAQLKKSAIFTPHHNTIVKTPQKHYQSPYLLPNYVYYHTSHQGLSHVPTIPTTVPLPLASPNLLYPLHGNGLTTEVNPSVHQLHNPNIQKSLVPENGYIYLDSNKQLFPMALVYPYANQIGLHGVAYGNGLMHPGPVFLQQQYI